MGRRERRLDPDDGVLQRFALELRQLRESAGRPSYRELAKRAHYSTTALSEAAGGETFPSLPVTLAYVRACGGDPDEWRQHWESTARELAPDDDPGEVAKAPYLGLTSFQPEDADRFFGRRRLLGELSARIDKSSFLAVFGASGSGKSSLLRAGVLPAIWRGDLPGSEEWPTILLTPGSRPIEHLAIQLANLGGFSAVPVVADLRSEPGSVRVLVRQVLARRPGKARLVIVVDQFEETFTLCRDEGERNAFIECLLAVADGTDGRVLLGVRADFYARCAQYPALVDALRDSQVLVGPMDSDDLRSVIREPAVRAGLAVEAALVEAVVADAASEPGALPLVSHALLETWKRRAGDRMTLAGYRRAGGVHGAIARTADRVFGEFDIPEQRVVRDIFLRLTALGEGTEDTRRRVARTELLDGSEEVLARLAEQRLVTIGADTVEVAHEALIRSWPRLRTWLAEDREVLSAHRRLTDTVAEWERHGRDDGLLYRGARLATWQDRPQDRLNNAERDFLNRSRRAADRERLARRRRVRLAFGGLSAATVVVTVLAVLALVLANQADVERDLAQSRQLIADARAQSQLDPELGVLLARQAFQVRPGADTEAALRQAAVESHVLASVSGHEGKVSGVAFSPTGRQLVTGGTDGALRVWRWRDGDLSGNAPIVLRGHRDHVWSLAFSPDGTRIAAAGEDGVVSVWHWATGRAVMLRGHQDEVWGAAFSPDGLLVASSGQDGTVRVWRADGSGQPVVLRGHTGRVLGVSFSPDGRRLASSGGDGTVRIWQLDVTGDPTVLEGHKNSVEAVQFSPDGRHVATASTDGTTRVWDATGATDPLVLGTHDGTAEGVAYSADGKWIASTGNDGTVRIWNADSHASPTVLRGHRGTVWTAAFSPDGKAVASASDDGTARVWSLEETGDLVISRSHTGPAWRAEFGQDGLVASAGEDGTVHLWDTSDRTDPVVLHGAGAPMRQVVFSPTGRHVAGVDADGTVWVWPVEGGREPVTLPGGDRLVWQVAFSQDGRRIAVADGNDSVRVWNVTGTGEPMEIRGGQGKLYYVAWSSDGRRVAAAGLSGAVVVWDIVRRTDPVVLRGHRGQVWTLAFSQDGTRVASGGNDGTARIWPVTGKGEPVVLHGHQGVVWSAAFTRDGRYLATSGNDATVRLWRLSRPGEYLVFRGFRASVETVAVAHDGRFVTAHDDGSVRLWRCPVCGPIADVLTYADEHVTRELTREERDAYLDGTT